MERMDTCAFALAADPVTGEYGGLAATWLMRSAYDPRSWTISLGNNTKTLRLVLRSGVFVLSFATPAMERAFEYFGVVSGSQGINKFAETGLRTAAFGPLAIATPMLPDAHANIACRVTHLAPAGSDYMVITGRVIGSQQRMHTRQLFYSGKSTAGVRQFRVAT